MTEFQAGPESWDGMELFKTVWDRLPDQDWLIQCWCWHMPMPGLKEWLRTH